MTIIRVNKMDVSILHEAGYFPAMLGLSLSYNQNASKMSAVADRLYNKGLGHNKFLESLVVWIDINAPRYWWSQADTYRVGTTKQSESTMHTILRNSFTEDDFEGGLDGRVLEILNFLRDKKDFKTLKRMLPESYLQRRIMCTNYMALRNMISQRYTHKLDEWVIFCRNIMRQVGHPEFFKDLEEACNNEWR